MIHHQIIRIHANGLLFLAILYGESVWRGIFEIALLAMMRLSSLESSS